ncbi:MAG: rod shape-determining protein RodA [Candidatus Moranbacteria bacterium]|nr:rod shape-determining protein RodA [Candidatus Moranbacteria bacterium]
MFEQVKKIDIILTSAVCLLCTVSLLLLYGISTAVPGTETSFFARQSLYIATGGIAMLIVANINPEYFRHYSKTIYFTTIAILIGVLIFGTTVRGTSGWISFGGFNVQPVEFAKIALIIFLASFIAKKQTELREVVRIIVSFALTAIMIFFVLRQPDFGSAMVLLGIWLGMIFVSGVNKKYLAAILIGFVCCAVIGWALLADYQKTRVMTFLDPSQDPRGGGYNVIQAMIAVGSGGITGNGIGQGTQSQLNFLPEKHTDFIFATLTEETGLIGATFVIGLFTTILYRIRKAAMKARNNFDYLVAAGVMIMLFWQIGINIGMNIGIVPVTGIPLPLMSYGGSSILATFLGLGIVMSIFRTGKKDTAIVAGESY